MRKCCFCEKELGPTAAGPHLNCCGNKYGLFDKKEIKFKYIEFNFPELSNKEFLKKEYVDGFKSLPMLKEEYGIDSKALIFLLDYHKIKKRTISQSAILISQKKIKKTCLEKYGDTNVCGKNSPILKKRNETIQKKYNVDNPYQIEEVKEKIFGDKIYIEKYNLTRSQLLSKNGKEVWARLTDEQKNKWLENSIRSDMSVKKIVGYKVSKLESRIQDCLNELFVKYEPQFCIKISSKKRKFYDFFIKDSNILLEINGDYWHANPKLYSENDVVFFRFGNIIAKDIWKKDEEKKKIAEDKGYKLITIWEGEIKNTTHKELINFILKQLS